MTVYRAILRIGVMIFLLCLVVPQRSYCQEAADDEAWQRYEHILHSSTLEWLLSQPFLLRVDFQLYDLDGNPAEKGTAEESWTHNDGKVIRITSPSLNEDGRSNDLAKTYKRESYLVRQALSAISRPFPAQIGKRDFAIDEVRQTVGGTEFSCFSFARTGFGRDEQPAYCTDSNNRLVATTGHFFTIERSDFRRSRDHEIPMELKLSYQGKTAVIMHVSELDALPKESATADKIEPPSGASTISGAVLAGAYLKKKTPDYPKEARKKRIGGSVLISALISKEGTIAYLDAIASPNGLLTKSALDAVRTWTYQPYLLNGIPTEVDTMITVNYNLNR